MAFFRTNIVWIITITFYLFFGVVQLQVNSLCPPRPQRNHALVEIPVLYETDRILIINKPCGIGHHNDDDKETTNRIGNPGVLQLLRQQRSEKKERLWGVHRLDKVTSGILVLAKNPEMASLLSQSFAHGRIQKIYFGVSAKKPKKKKQGWVAGGMVRSRRETWMLTTASTTNFAKTRFFTAGMNNMSSINKTMSEYANYYGPRTVIMFHPYTGKTHQLRVAAKSLGIPLMGDPLYESGLSTKKMTTNIDSNTFENLRLPSSRTMLHASGIHIPSCTTMEDPISVWCDPPFFNDSTTVREDEVSLSLTHDCFHSAVMRLMTKHCDIPGILDAMLLSHGDSNTQPTYLSRLDLD